MATVRRTREAFEAVGLALPGRGVAIPASGGPRGHRAPTRFGNAPPCPRLVTVASVERTTGLAPLVAGRCVAGTPSRSGPAPRRRRGGRPRRTARPSGDGLCAARRRTAGHRALRDAHPARRVLPVGPVADPRPRTRLGGVAARRRGDHSAGRARRCVDRIALAGMLAILVGAIMLAGGHRAVWLRHRAAVDAGAPRLPDGHCRDGGGGAAPEALRILDRLGELPAGSARLRHGTRRDQPDRARDRCYLARGDPHPAAGGAEHPGRLSGGRRRDSAGGRARACGRGAGRRRCPGRTAGVRRARCLCRGPHGAASGGVRDRLRRLAHTSVLSRSYAGRLRQEFDQNQELGVLGVANIATGFFQGFPSRPAARARLSPRTLVHAVRSPGSSAPACWRCC